MSTCRGVLAMGLAIFIGATGAAAQSALKIPDREVWEHRITPVKLIHSERFDPRSSSLHDTIALEVIVGTDGVVESARAVDGPREFFAEAELLERGQRFRPFEKDGVPVRAAIRDYVRLGPAEQWSAQRVPFPEIKDWGSLRMTLSRTTCFGECPAYSVEVRGGGTVTYQGKEFVLITGEHHSRISRKQVQQLFAKFRQADYFSLKDEYKASITDSPTKTTSIEFDGRRKQVKDYVGSYVGMPEVVTELEGSFDELAGTKKWVKETSETWPSLVAEHWDFKATTSENAGLFASVVAQGSKELVDHFVNAGSPALTMANLRLGQQSALESAAARGNLDLVNRMLDTHDDLPAPVMFQALRAAAGSGNLELVRLLIEHGANVNGAPANPKDPRTVLMSAVDSGKVDVVKEILLHRPDVNARFYSGETALIMFLERGGQREPAEEIVKVLIAAGASVTQTGEQGHIPLFAACSTPQAVKLLVAAGADVNARDRGGRTALMNCSYRKDFVAAMLEAGADPSLRDQSGQTALDHARHTIPNESVQLLEAAMKKRAGE
jgi:ankyrin repeat protein